MTRFRLGVLLAAIALAGNVRPAPADEIDDLADKIKLRDRFRGYKPKFHYTQNTFTFQHPTGPKQMLLRLVMDDDKYIAVVGDDHIQLLSITPGTARTSLPFRAGRYHLDNFRGPTIPTGDFLEGVTRFTTAGVKGIPRTDHFREGGTHLTLVRASDTGRRRVLNRFVFRVDERFGYVIEATFTALFKRPVEGEDRKASTSVFCPNTYVPWPTRWLYDRTVICPDGSTGYYGWCNNTIAIDRADRDPRPFIWRDKGFIAFLNPSTGWSICRTRSDGGPAAPMTLDNLRNQFDVTIPFAEELPKDLGERETYTAVHRLLPLPPEMTEHIRKNMKFLDVGADPAVVCRIGQTEDFEDQPVAMTEPIRGLAWTENPPVVSRVHAHSGSRSLRLKGNWGTNDPRVFIEPDIPQISLRPNATYLLEAWLKVDSMADGDREDYLNAYRDMVAELKKKLKEQQDGKAERLPWEEDPEKIPAYVPPRRHGQAYITAHLYETSPAKRHWLVRQQTTAATAETAGWQKVSLTFTTGEWDPYVHIAFVCNSGSAYLDDFTFKRIK